MITREFLEKRIAELTKQRENLLANLNVLCGQLHELSQMLTEVKKSENPTLVEVKETVKMLEGVK